MKVTKKRLNIAVLLATVILSSTVPMIFASWTTPYLSSVQLPANGSNEWYEMKQAPPTWTYGISWTSYTSPAGSDITLIESRWCPWTGDPNEPCGEGGGNMWVSYKNNEDFSVMVYFYVQYQYQD